MTMAQLEKSARKTYEMSELNSTALHPGAAGTGGGKGGMRRKVG